ncbi:MAG: ABC transporter permease [Deltaproteobacteria bacterium]|jgi:tungstate transport system permease protein|nr:ABC transporter permease [Deltaproteobacteria bacterium]
MDIFLDSFIQALKLIFSGDREVWKIVFLSLSCTFWACLGAALAGLPAAFILGYCEFRLKKFFIVLFNTLQSVPTVVVGLFLYVFISRRGIFGPLDLLYSPRAISIGQFILITPLIIMFALAALSRLDRRYHQSALTLGASQWQAALAVWREARFALVAAICAAFGRGVAEVGVSMMLGGNIRGYTRTMTTAMALEYDKGEFITAVALGLVLLGVSFALNFFLGLFQSPLRRTA